MRANKKITTINSAREREREDNFSPQTPRKWVKRSIDADRLKDRPRAPRDARVTQNNNKRIYTRI